MTCMHSFRLARRVALLTICGLSAVAGSASAATITAESGQLVVRAEPGEANYIGINAINEAPGDVYVDDTPALQYDTSVCRPAFGGGFNAVVCAAQPGGVRVEAGDGADIVNVQDKLPASVPVTVLGGPGDDVLRGAAYAERSDHLDGGDGNDKITAGAGADVVDGGAGDDEVEGQGGTDIVRGGAGDDTLRGDAHNDPASADLLDGGPGYDAIDGDWMVESGKHQPPIAVSEDGQANDGRPGEGDNVTGLERIYLNAPATLVGDDEDDEYTVFNTDAQPSKLVGGGGNDTLSAYDYDDTIDGGTGDDTLIGGYGNDTITGGPGKDRIFADVSSTTCSYIQCRLPQGNDTILARDGEVDQVDCGVGVDTAYVDPADSVSSCETVITDGPAPTPGVDPTAAVLTGKVRATRLRNALARGLTLVVSAPAAGNVEAMAKRGGRVVATGRATAPSAGKVAVRLRFTKRGRRSLGRARRARIAIAMTFSPSQGAAVRGQTTTTLAR
jgi:Ca2+-binding RTX toxin-like protein